MGKARGDEVRWTIEPTNSDTPRPSAVYRSFPPLRCECRNRAWDSSDRATVSTHHHVFLNAEIEKEAVVLEGAGNAQLGDPLGRQPVIGWPLK